MNKIEYQIPEGYEARIEGNKVIIEPKDCEDEIIRNRIIGYLKQDIEEHPERKERIEDMLAWLEKQGLQNTNIHLPSFDEAQGTPMIEQCSSNLANSEKTCKVKPKFHEGEWVVFNNKHQSIYQVEKIEDGYYILRHIHGGTFRVCVLHDESLRLWTVQDAKDGDVLSCENGWTCIFKTLDNHANTFSSYCFIDNNKWFCNMGSLCHTLDKAYVKAYNGEIHPSTKKQRDILMKAMNDAGYTFDFEKKELKKIEQKPNFCHHEVDFSGCSEEYRKAYYDGWNNCNQQHKQLEAEQKPVPAWSEEDEKLYNSALWHIKNSCGNGGKNSGEFEVYHWLKSLKDRVQPKKEWSEEDEIRFESTLHRMEIVGNGCAFGQLKDDIAWLKSLKEKCTRTDVFIEKACEYLNNNCRRFILTEKNIEDFKNYMKGE